MAILQFDYGVPELLSKCVDSTKIKFGPKSVYEKWKLAVRDHPYISESGDETPQTTNVSEWLLATRIKKGHSVNDVITVEQFQWLQKVLW